MLTEKLKQIYNLFPRRFFTTYSWPVKSFDEFMGCFRKHIATSRCSTSIYNYDGNENNVVVDRIAFDLDSKGSYEQAKKLHEYLFDKNVKHFVVFSGANFHIYAKVDGVPTFKKDCIRNMCDEISKATGIENDSSLVGNLSHNLSIPFSFNFKRMRYVRPLTNKELYSGYDNICSLAKRQGGEIEFVGEEPINCEKYDFPTRKTIEPLADEDFDKLDDAIYKMLPKDVKALLEDSKPGHKARLMVFTRLIEFGLTRGQILAMVKEIWEKEVFYHSVVEERQLDFIMRKKYEVLLG